MQIIMYYMIKKNAERDSMWRILFRIAGRVGDLACQERLIFDILFICVLCLLLLCLLWHGDTTLGCSLFSFISPVRAHRGRLF